ncbi:ATP-binding protein [Naasia sp. SYSU D00057]|uniref:ATP-binding protein n=1 Tax=Naasia sp. SYSU D00057 TaxID=2817380 RepID=UPI001B3037D1|nr:ATP-binding protein [Naasia sp. SYSU D00057]
MSDGGRASFRGPVAPDILAQAQAVLAEALAGAPPVPVSIAGRADLAISEVLSNILQHGEEATEVSLAVEVTPVLITALIEDDGGEVPAGDGTMTDPEAESGRGRAIVSAVVDRGGYERRNGRNVWRLELDVPA